MFVFVLLCITLCLFLFCNHLEKEEKAGCFAIIVLKMYYYYKCSVAFPHSAVSWSAVYVIVVFPDNTHLLFKDFFLCFAPKIFINKQNDK